ncbi:MAG: nucleotidyltransferase domain-containing protein [Planctomycetota bacterium]
MNTDRIAEVWSMLDREHLARVARSGPLPIFATVSGAHLYGFASPDSDVDLRGAFLHPLKAVLGLEPPDETISIDEVSTIELDWVAHDLRKFARLMTRHNGYVLEQLYSPLVVISSPAHEELMAIGQGCITRPTVRHYQGFARGRRERLVQPAPTVKHLLYAYRVLLTGIHLMSIGVVVSNVEVLNERFRLSEIEELVARKRAGHEKMKLAPEDLQLHGPTLDRLEAELAAAHRASHLPEEPTTVPALEDFVIRARLANSEA